MHHQLFETWNEPLRMTANCEWTNTSWERYFDACNERSKQDGGSLCFGAPSRCESITLLYPTLNHVSDGTSYFDPNDTNNNKLRKDFISVHDKCNEDQITVTDEDLAIESIVSGNKYSTLLQRVNQRVLLSNVECDTKVAWSEHYEWIATTGCAAFMLQGIGNNNNLNNITLGLISDDNYSMCDGTMRQRIVNTRFMINNSNSNDVQFEYVPDHEPPFHGNTLFVNFSKRNGDD